MAANNQIWKFLTFVTLIQINLMSNLVLSMSVKNPLSYPMSRYECVRQTQNMLNCSENEYYDVHCTCVHCEATWQHCSQPRPSDEFCSKLKELYYCDNSTKTTTLPSTSASTTREASTITHLSTLNSVASVASRFASTNNNAAAAYNYQSTTNYEQPNYVVFLAIGLVLIIIFAALVAALLLGRTYSKRLPKFMQQWRIFGRAASVPSSPPEQTQSSRPLLARSLSAGVTQTTPPAQLLDVMDPVLAGSTPGIPASGTTEQQSATPGSRRDQDNARKKVAASASANATSSF
ncbi:hypothetical protein BOX15_Mlig030720g6 [Macrostomum lignano]|uniref:TNFR-Cys domain-containing protein n=1 Tax=Macrostomum lignano TaxID=282301 RepID=A0A267EXW8_9PLAT|nr:hypothetical protein BOX15_Mlig032714g4 [Macrostomum lignano]PAA63852.1 hypothetical protein BOX15_Mlig032714g2 [Macrostomum lignano]PAA65777.1 hypothetical protein BOX15_Mlig030720g6 [Macrostomum lignano]